MLSFGRISAGVVTTPLRSTSPSHEMIARRAYRKWQARGCPSGTHLQDWLEAETELKAEMIQGRQS
jgi:hypothetical protein